MKILIVEDEVKLVDHLKHGLEQEGYSISIVYEGEDAEKFILFNHELLDLIIMDDMLPLKMGSEVVRTVRANNVDTPILMLTAKDTDQDVVHGLNVGVDDYLPKPFSFQVLLARIRALLRRQKSHKYMGEELRIGDLVLNTSSRKVVYNTKELRLTLKEFNLLEYFMRHPDEALDREKILEKVWDINFDSFSNVIDVHITYLRKKLKEVGCENKLEAVRGVGYRLKK